jgi:kynurenine--oxoglutarate transaminase/cysteine-S-conjugate beta-lyase/glutamine--phenylpyruvate transaminase
VWHEFTPLAAKVKAVNLGQGFPGWLPPKFVQNSLSEVSTTSNFLEQQYARSQGHLPLCEAIASRYTSMLGRTVNPMTEVAISNGASGALFQTIHGFVDPGDEVVLITPAFDLYFAQTETAGGVCRTVPLRRRENKQEVAEGGEWRLDMKELRAAFNDKTKVLLINTPHNPTGKVMTRPELEEVAALLRDFPRVVCICDEVYDQISFTPHVPLASLPGMWDRCVTIGSAGKLFSITGWKVGWCVGPQHLVQCSAVMFQWVAFSVCTPAQVAVSNCLRVANEPYEGFPNYYSWLLNEYSRKRDIMRAALTAAGLEAVEPQGAFFFMADTRRIRLPQKYLDLVAGGMARDWAMCRFFTEVIGVCAIPPSAFYDPVDAGLAANYARFAFCKPDDVLHEAAARLLALREYQAPEPAE